MGRFQLELIYPYFFNSTPRRPVENVVITTKGLQDRNNLLLDGRTVGNKGKLILMFYYIEKINGILRKNRGEGFEKSCVPLHGGRGVQKLPKSCLASQALMSLYIVRQCFAISTGK